MAQTVSNDAWDDIWRRYGWIWSLVYLTSLLLPLLVFINRAERTAAPFVWPLVGAAVLWHLAMVAFTWRRGRLSSAVALGYCLGLILLFYLLVQQSPAFFFFLGGIFSQIFGNLRSRYSVPLALLLTVVAAYLQLTEPGSEKSLSDPIIWFFFFGSATGILLALWIGSIIDQSTQRRELIDQLRAAQADLAAAERREGVQQERERLARDIHDTLAQGFISIVMHLEAADQTLGDENASAKGYLMQAQATARASLEQARRVVQDLRPEVLESAPLPEAMARMAAGWAAESGVAAQTAVTGSYRPLHPQAEVTLIRAVQEALANVRKHAQATEVRLTLSYMPDVVVLDVQDNGVGLAAASPPANGAGFGLTAMRQRVAQVGGKMQVESEPNEGTTVVVELPLDEG